MASHDRHTGLIGWGETFSFTGVPIAKAAIEAAIAANGAVPIPQGAGLCPERRRAFWQVSVLDEKSILL